MSAESSQFEPESFLHSTFTEANTRRSPIAAGQDFIGTIKDIVERKNVAGKKDPSKTYHFMDVVIVVDVPAELQASGQPPNLTFTDGILLDKTPTGQLDMGAGKNGKLRRYRESLDMNTPGKPFSFSSMIGRQIRVKLKHEFYEGETYERVDSVAKV